MGSEPDAEDDAACCSCNCHGRLFSSPAWRRCVKRKLEEMEEGGRGLGLGLRAEATARVEVENEAVALREALASHQQTVAELWEELEEERAASATAASETMSMILRLQREKAEAQMESRQFKRFVEEKMAHDQQELVALEDLLYKREQALQAVSCEVQAYRHRLLSYGIHPDSVDPTVAADAEAPEVDDAGTAVETPTYEYQPAFEYPQLRCQDTHLRLDPSFDEEDADDLDVYPSGATPRPREQLQSLEQRIHHLERTQSRSSTVLETEKGVVMGQSPRPVRTEHYRQLSTDTFASPLAREQQMCNGKQREELLASAGSSPGGGDDDSNSDRVYTVDAVHRGAVVPQAPTARACEEYVSTPREAVCRVDIGSDGGQQETDIKKMYMRLEALEADRESMRQALLSMRTDKAQLVLLKEIAQHLYRDASSPPPPPGRKLVKKPTPLGNSFVSMVKWIVSLVFWRTATQRSKHIVGLSSNNAGLLLLLEKGQHMRQWRCLSRIQGSKSGVTPRPQDRIRC